MHLLGRSNHKNVDLFPHKSHLRHNKNTNTHGEQSGLQDTCSKHLNPSKSIVVSVSAAQWVQIFPYHHDCWLDSGSYKLSRVSSSSIVTIHFRKASHWHWKQSKKALKMLLLFSFCSSLISYLSCVMVWYTFAHIPVVLLISRTVYLRSVLTISWINACHVQS